MEQRKENRKRRTRPARDIQGDAGRLKRRHEVFLSIIYICMKEQPFTCFLSIRWKIISMMKGERLNHSLFKKQLPIPYLYYLIIPNRFLRHIFRPIRKMGVFMVHPLTFTGIIPVFRNNNSIRNRRGGISRKMNIHIIF